MFIRKANLEDIHQLVECFKSFKIELQGHVLKDISKYRTTLKSNSKISDLLKVKVNDKDSQFLVAIQDKQIVGFIFGTVRYMYHDIYEFDGLKEGYLSNLWVDIDYRRQGISTQLINKLTCYFEDNDCELIRLDVLYNNNAKQFYRDLGYVDYLVCMVKQL